MENPGFQNDEAEIESPPPPATPPPPPRTPTPPPTTPPLPQTEITSPLEEVPPEDVVPKGILSKKRNSVVFAVEEDKVTTITNGVVIEEVPSSSVITSPSRKLILIQKLHPELNLSPLIELLGNSISFNLTTKYLACYPTMTLVPFQFTPSQTEASSVTQPNSEQGNGTTPTSPSPTLTGYEIMARAQKRWNWTLCCCPSSINSQKVSVTRRDSSGDEVFNFTYTPHIWCPASHQERLVEIFMPGIKERMGWIEAGRDVGIGSEIGCGFTKELFITRQVEEKGSPRSFKIENSAGLEVANGKVVTSAWMGNCGSIGRWMGFTFNFVPSELDTLSHPTRAVLLAAFLLWVIDAREKRQWQFLWSILFVLFLVTCFLVIKVFGPDES